MAAAGAGTFEGELPADKRTYTLLRVKEMESSEPGTEQKNGKEERTILAVKQTAEGKYFYLTLDICITTLHYCTLLCTGHLLPRSGLPGGAGECQGE